MATQQDQLIQAIRRIAKSDPEIRSVLTALQKRGALDGLVKLVGGSDAAALEDCCTKGDEADPEDKGEDPNAGTIDGERPDDGNNEKGMDGTYRMPDGSFADWDNLPCTPDESWKLGTYWPGGYSTIGAAVSAAAAAASGQACTTLGGVCYDITYVNADRYEVDYYCCENSHPIGSSTFLRINCGSSTADYCQLTTAPCAEDQDWQADGKCQEALINGRFVPHPKDPDCAGQLPQDYQIMCDADKCIAYIPTADGGHMRVEVDPVTRLPVAGSDVKTYGSDGQFKGSNEYRYDNVKYNAYGENSVPSNWE